MDALRKPRAEEKSDQVITVVQVGQTVAWPDMVAVEASELIFYGLYVLVLD